MPLTAEDIIKHYEYDPSKVQRIASRKVKCPVALVDYNPGWPSRFQSFRDGIVAALGPIAKTVSHVGSTSIPDMPAKDVIDIDLVVADILDEDAYVPLLEGAGWTFKHREPSFHQHRFFCRDEPYSGNLHVWAAESAEAERHRIFREWICGHPDDRELYLQAKRGAVADTVAVDGSVMDYNLRKEKTIREILERSFRSLGYLKADEGVAWDSKRENEE